MSSAKQAVVLDENKVDTDVISMGWRAIIEVSQVDHDRTRETLEELVCLRNELVHHFIDRFDVWTLDGCLTALGHLGDCFARIDGHFGQLRQWAESFKEMAKEATSYMQSPAFREWIVNGIAPDGTVNWFAAGIVSCLREVAGRHAAHDGWTSLDQAMAFIAASHPEQTPQKYGCRTWPQVLNESRTFELRYGTAENGRREGRYRERIASQPQAPV